PQPRGWRHLSGWRHRPRATLVLPLLLATATPAVAAGDHSHPVVAAAGLNPVVAALIRVVVVLASTAVAGIGLLRPLTGEPGERTRVVAWAAASVAVTACLASTLGDVPLVIAIAQSLLTVLIPALLAWRTVSVLLSAGLTALIAAAFAPADQLRAAGIGYVVATTALVGVVLAVLLSQTDRAALARRLTPIGLAAVLVALSAGVVWAFQIGLRLDVRLVTTPYGLVTIAQLLLTVLAAAAFFLLRERPGIGRTVGIGGVTALTLAIVSGAALAAIPLPQPHPVAGVPLLRSVSLGGQDVPVLLTPAKPGRNLVHVGVDKPEEYAAGTSSSTLAALGSRSGGSGGWGFVDLPAGPGKLVLGKGDEQVAIDYDAGDGPAAAPVTTGDDGIECASVALAVALTDHPVPLGACPSEQLGQPDTEALRGEVNFLAGRGVSKLSLSGDNSPRSVAATEVVRKQAVAKGIEVTDQWDGQALLVVAGWTAGADQLNKVAEQSGTVRFQNGIYLAPWLLYPRVIGRNSGAILPIRFNPHEQLPVVYSNLVGQTFPGDFPSASGFARWLDAQPESVRAAINGKPALFTASVVSFLPTEFNHGHDSKNGWFPQGTVVQISQALDTGGNG
ncbi:hypothetical protein D5S17_29955, partial [Pseudonocardiaceae bacterium YIM PH 21723]